MPLHHSQQTELDYLLPEHIIEYGRFDRFDLKLKLTATDAQGRWPSVNIWLDNQLLTTGQAINGTFEFAYSEVLDMSKDVKHLEIEYFNKTNQDTVTNDVGEIIQNQSLTLAELIVNDVDVIGSQIIYQLGNYTMDLPPEKRSYYLEHGYNVEPTHSLGMYENGRWKLRMPIPILTNFVRLKAKQEKHEKWPDPELLMAIVTKVNNIRQLEKKLKEQQ